MSDLIQIAGLCDQYRQQYQMGQISANDYKELINDLDAVNAIQEEAGELEDDVMYRNIILAAVQLAQAIA